MLGASPSQAFFVSGDSLSLSCHAEGVPQPSASWMFGGQTLPVSQGGSLNLTNVQTSQGGIYTCVLVNVNTGAQRKRNLTVNVYGRVLASVEGVIRYTCFVFDIIDLSVRGLETSGRTIVPVQHTTCVCAPNQ